MSRQNDIKRLILKHNRRLQALREKQALYGLETPVSILTEIEDIETEIKKLQVELEQLEQSTTSRHEIDERLTSPRMRLWFVIVFAMILGVVGATIILYAQVSKYSSFAPDFTPTWISSAASNAKNDNYIAQNPNIPEPLTWYEFNSGNLRTSTTVQLDYSEIDHYLYYSSVLTTKEYSWSGFLFSRKFPLPELNASGKSEIIAIIYAENPDTLEIGFKDAHGNEKKIALKVVKGWAGYRVSLAEFTFIDFNRIQLFLIAHSRGVGSIDANAFKFAFLGLR